MFEIVVGQSDSKHKIPEPSRDLPEWFGWTFQTTESLYRLPHDTFQLKSEWLPENM
jgi:hypothetical protein